MYERLQWGKLPLHKPHLSNSSALLLPGEEEEEEKKVAEMILVLFFFHFFPLPQSISTMAVKTVS